MFSAQPWLFFPYLQEYLSVPKHWAESTRYGEIHGSLQNCRCSRWNFLHVTLLPFIIWRQFLDFWKICGPLPLSAVLSMYSSLQCPLCLSWTLPTTIMSQKHKSGESDETNSMIRWILWWRLGADIMHSIRGDKMINAARSLGIHCSNVWSIWRIRSKLCKMLTVLSQFSPQLSLEKKHSDWRDGATATGVAEVSSVSYTYANKASSLSEDSKVKQSQMLLLSHLL